VVPLRSMLRHRERAGSDVEARLLLSAKRQQDVIYRAELQSFDVTCTYTREAPPGWTGYARRVDREMLAEAGFAPEQRPRIYVCGPTGFVEGVANELVALGHAPDRIRTERFGATGV
jgi:ferredoxin-NADP reductase